MCMRNILSPSGTASAGLTRISNIHTTGGIASAGLAGK
jgi:hypothetical protein